MVERDTSPYFLALQLIAMPLGRMMPPVNDFLSLLSAAKSASLNDSSLVDEHLTSLGFMLIFIVFVPFR